MIRVFITFLLLSVFSFLAAAQEYALDFTRTDCKGVEYDLFSEHDSGKVIILDFVMLGCSPCFWATRDIDTIVTVYAASHPDRVEIYAFSYENDHTCEQMFEWRAAGGFPDVKIFTQGADLVDYYGGMGMPTIVVTGSSEHRVFYNGYGYTAADDLLITAAIDNALNYDQSGIGDDILQNGFKVFPTFFSDWIVVETEKNFSGSEIIIFDIYGRQALSLELNSNLNQKITTAGLPKGIYFARLLDGTRFSGSIKLIKY